MNCHTLKTLYFVTAILLTGCGPSVVRAPRSDAASRLSVAIEDFEVPPQAYIREYSAQDYQVAFRKALIDEFTEAGVAITTTTTPSTLIVGGKILQANPGNRGLRYLGGYTNSGEARFQVSGQVRRDDGAVVGEFSASRHAGGGLFGGNSKTLINNCVDSVAIDVVNMVVTGRYEVKEEDSVVRANALFLP